MNGPAFLAGWIAGIAVLGAIVLVAASGASASKHGSPATWVSIVKIVLGVPIAIYFLMRDRAAGILGDCATGWPARTPQSWP